MRKKLSWRQLDKNELKVRRLMKIQRRNNILLDKLITFHELTMDALSLESKGHTPNWQKIMDLSTKIEDNYDLLEIKETL